MSQTVARVEGVTIPWDGGLSIEIRMMRERKRLHHQHHCLVLPFPASRVSTAHTARTHPILPERQTPTASAVALRTLCFPPFASLPLFLRFRNPSLPAPVVTAHGTIASTRPAVICNFASDKLSKLDAMAGDAFSALMESWKEYLEPAAKVAMGVKEKVRGRWGSLARVSPMPADP